MRSLPRLLLLLSLAGFLSACSGAALLNSVTSRAGYETVRNLRYMPGDRGTLDLYVPNGAGPATPIVVFIYGGSWDSGSKSIYPFVGQSLASAGYIVAIPDYRVYPDVLFPGFVEDGARAVAAVRKLGETGGAGLAAGSHPLFLMGHSAGAQIAALLAYDKRYLSRAGGGPVAGFIGLSGPYDFLPLKEERYKRIFPLALREASQPVNFVGRGDPPTFLAHGGKDTTVDPENMRSLARRLRAAGVPVSENLYPGLDHIGTVSSFATALPLGNRQLRADVLDFLKDHSR
ncbi:alpha/beta hydrolase [Aureimonas phyllosphaerae]|uniref:Acetyl esterase/lipase n=1 Tax=Aureimonas phyllosphaerae TaxID=1166078 RepID=A0A7W6BXS9_9HYPH|nr:alpha/beta hydrolase [Aureimonas phyllosphaerae]MBB3935666.1 acetyl esterase/lipase [Aureimonas phyllosphaerae]MBB3959674.1 acetyl esterase/lipase [Aureimonas phyllosphaerae]SFF13606.1 Acetyl esterase/lipase [Aureimonas phyllosphaerae]